MASPQTTRRQHFVWQHYLKAWSNADTDKIFVYLKSENKIKDIKPTNVGLQRDFYKLDKLSKNEIRFVKHTIDKMALDYEKELLHKLVDMFQRLHSMDDKLLEQDEFKESRNAIKHLAIQTGEDLQTQAELAGLPYLNKLRECDTSFLCNETEKNIFYQFIAYQYFRTKNIASKIMSATKSQNRFNINTSKASKYLIHMFSMNLAFNLTFRNQTRIELLKNSTNTHFITIDQPVINLKVENTDKQGFAKELLLFYPLSPCLALKVFPAEENYCIQKDVSEEEVTWYNIFMKRNFLDQVYSKKKEYLEDLIKDQSS